jgi:hypothetical protein
MRDSITRRRMLLGTGAAATGVFGSMIAGSQNATATVSGDFSIPDGTTVLADATLTDVRLEVDVAWGYEANAPMHAVELELYVGDTLDTADLIARHTKEDFSQAALTGEAELNGSLMSSSDFDIADFRPSNGQLRRTVVADLRLYVLRNEELVVDAAHTTAFDVVVNNEELQVDATLDATGEVTFNTESA